MSRLWMASLGGEVLHVEDLPTCCRRDSRYCDDGAGFECSVCGAMWENADTEVLEICAFTYSPYSCEEQRRGAA